MNLHLFFFVRSFIRLEAERVQDTDLKEICLAFLYCWGIPHNDIHIFVAGEGSLRDTWERDLVIGQGSCEVRGRLTTVSKVVLLLGRMDLSE